MAIRAAGLVLAAASWAALSGIGIPAAHAAGPDPSFLSTASVRDGFEGTTRDAAGRRLPFVEVRVLSGLSSGSTTVSISRVLAEQAISTVRSDAAGRFFVAGLLPGSYRLVATKGGYAVVIGQINTLLSASVDLVLHPAGPGGAPGTKPDDNSWTLRLPQRDRLEQESYRVANRYAGSERFGEIPIRVELNHTRVDGNAADASSGSGVGIGVAAGWRLAEGVCRASARYRVLGGDGDFQDEGHSAQLRWDGAPAEGMTLSIALSRDARSRQPAFVVTDRSFITDLKRDDLQVLGSLVQDGVRHEWRTEFGRSQIDEPALPGGDEARLARWVSARWSMEQTVGEHSVMLSASGRSAGGAWQATADGRPTAAAIAAVVPADAGALGAVSGGAVEVGAADAWTAAPGITVTGRTRAEYAGGFDRGMRASVSAGAAWQAAPWLDLKAEVGTTSGPGRNSIWTVQWLGAVDAWSWSLSRSRETGLAPWNDQDAYLPANERWLTDRAGLIGRWTARLEHSGHGRLPGLSLRIERYEMEGRLAARLAGDRTIVPILDDAAGRGQQLEFGVSFPSIGTALIVSLNQIDDQGGPGPLLGGVSQWRQTTVSVRQQLAAMTWHGAATQLFLGLEDGRASSGTDRSPLDAARFALLDQRRLSGGLALSF